MENRPPLLHLQWQMTEFFTETAEWLQIHRDAVSRAGCGNVPALARASCGGDFSKTLAESGGGIGSERSRAALMKRGKIQAHFRAEMAHWREELLATMEGHLRRAIEQFYKESQDESLQPLQGFYVFRTKIDLRGAGGRIAEWRSKWRETLRQDGRLARDGRLGIS